MLNEELADKNQVIQEFYKAQRSPVEPLKAREIELMAKRNHEELNFSEKTLKRMSEVESFKLGDLVSFTQEEF